MAQTPSDNPADFATLTYLVGHNEYTSHRNSAYSTASSLDWASERERGGIKSGMFDLEYELELPSTRSQPLERNRIRHIPQSGSQPYLNPVEGLGLGITSNAVAAHTDDYRPALNSSTREVHYDSGEQSQAMSEKDRCPSHFQAQDSLLPSRSSLNVDAAELDSGIETYAEPSDTSDENTTDSDVSISRSSFHRGLYSLEHELDQLLAATGQNLHKNPSFGPLPQRNFEEGKAVQLIENGKGTVVTLERGQLIENLHVPGGKPSTAGKRTTLIYLTINLNDRNNPSDTFWFDSASAVRSDAPISLECLV